MVSCIFLRIVSVYLLIRCLVELLPIFKQLSTSVLQVVCFLKNYIVSVLAANKSPELLRNLKC